MNSSLQKKISELCPHQNLFSVISWGACGTKWLSRILNSHPDIFCLHAANVLFKSFIKDCPAINDIDYFRFIAAEGSAHLVAGDVHGVSRDSVLNLQSEFGSFYRHAVLIRDPIPRLLSMRSFLNNFRDSDAYDFSYINQVADSINLDYKGWSFDEYADFHSLNMLNSIIYEKIYQKYFV